LKGFHVAVAVVRLIGELEASETRGPGVAQEGETTGTVEAWREEEQKHICAHPGLLKEPGRCNWNTLQWGGAER
jgi:hypothetical protein